MRYEGVKEASAAENVPVEIIKAARKYISKGFNHNRIDWDLVGVYIAANYDMLEQEANETIDALKKTRLKNTIVREGYEFDLVKDRYLEKTEVVQRIKDMASAQRILLKDALTETLPARLVGLSQNDMLIELTKVFEQVCDSMNKIKL